MHSAYVRDAFSHFDSCTAGVERAINDFDPLLHVNADDSKPATCGISCGMARSLYYWQFDWQSEAADHLSENPVMFPSLLRVMDGDGKRFAEPVVLGKKGVLKDE